MKTVGVLKYYNPHLKLKVSLRQMFAGDGLKVWRLRPDLTAGVRRNHVSGFYHAL